MIKIKNIKIEKRINLSRKPLNLLKVCNNKIVQSCYNHNYNVFFSRIKIYTTTLRF